MDLEKLGTMTFGIKAPIIKEGADIEKVVFDSVVDATNGEMLDGDVIGITESVVARAQGNYVTIDDIAEEVGNVISNKYIALWSPIMSRNRFAHILRGFARYCEKIIIFINDEFDEQGNPTHGINPYTGIDIQDYYNNICKEENCELMFKSTSIYKHGFSPEGYGYVVVDARCHPSGCFRFNLGDICSLPTRKHGYSNYGLLGSNMAGDERLKLFPNKDDAQRLVDNIQGKFKSEVGKNVEVLVYGDGCFKSPADENNVSIWELADPVTSPAYTHGLEGLPSEVKLKNLADGKFKNLTGAELDEAIKAEIRLQTKSNEIGALGTTPRKVVDLIASMADLTSGSGGKGTPIILIRNYFNNYAD